jgi:hypothetical protein
METGIQKKFNKIIWKRVFVVIGYFLRLVFLVTIPWILGWIEIFKWLLG